MSRPRFKTRAAGWAGVLVLGVAIVASVACSFHFLSWSAFTEGGTRLDLWLTGTGARLSWQRPIPMLTGIPVIGRLFAPKPFPVPLWPNMTFDRDAGFISLPWWPVMILAAAGAGLCRPWCRARNTGQCRGCGYDLRGTPPGSVCPECGRSSGPATG